MVLNNLVSIYAFAQSNILSHTVLNIREKSMTLCAQVGDDFLTTLLYLNLMFNLPLVDPFVRKVCQ